MKFAEIIIAVAVVGCGSRVDDVPASADTGIDSTSEAASDAVSDPVCPVGRLPTNGTPCDPARMTPGTYCRSTSCGWGSEDECFCDHGAWVCGPSSRDDYGCGTPPLCHEKTTPTCPGEDAGVVPEDAGSDSPSDAGCAPSKIALEATGPWDGAALCWPSTYRVFECVDGIDGGALLTCFYQVSTGEYWLASSTHIPSGTDYRYCTDTERAAHSTSSRCK